MKIIPIKHPLHATVRIPGSKSLTNRALLIAALADGTTRLTNALFSDDSLYFADALNRLGFEVYFDSERAEMTVTGRNGHILAKRANVFIGNAGTAARFLSAFLTLGAGEYILDGDVRMRQRPIGDLVDTLKQLGANVEPMKRESRIGNQPTVNGLRSTVDLQQICPPIKIIASGLPGGQASIAGGISSQFLSALLMVAPYAQNPVTLTVTTELNSKPYVDMTIAIMRDFGVEVHRDGYRSFSVPLKHYELCNTYAIESDASAASYFFAAPAILGGTVRVENISRRSKQGDVAFLDVLQQMGCMVVEGENYIKVTGPKTLRGVDVDMCDIPDTSQTLAAIAPFASSPTRIRGIASARVKETDRVAAVCTELTRLGVDVEEHSDGLTIQPCESISPASIQTYNDHRMAMAFALVGLRAPGVKIEDPGCVSKTFPNYFDVLETLR
jgi:3-phosphoshikimate 1-carboxyvinyltransferase